MKDVLETLGKILGATKDLPLWILVALAAAADVVEFLPRAAAQMPASVSWWVWVAVVVFNALAIFCAINVVHRIWHEFRAATAARRTFHLTPVENQCHWGMTKQADGSVTTQMGAHFLAKNLTEHPVALASVRLVRPRIDGETLSADVSVRAVRSNMYGSAVHSGHAIPAGLGLPAHAHVLIRGVPRQKASEPLHVTLAIADDEGNEQRVKVRFRSFGVPQPAATADVAEAAFAIDDPIEKDVVSVLQSEIARYNKYGRQVGGLGSLHVVYQGRALQGVGSTDAWNPNSPRNQSIADDPDAAILQSDNLDGLLVLCNRQPADQNRDKVVSALLQRLDEKGGYLRISYFIVCALWKLGYLKEALRRAKTSLPVGDISAFGLSNILMMLNGLLRYRHPDFTSEMLDEIENLIHELNESSFQIREKIASIRAHRLLADTA